MEARRARTPFSSPRPTPRFFEDTQTFSTKKARGTPRDSVPPRPPVKSCPPISRIFQHRPVTRAQIVSFRSETSFDDSVVSPKYNKNSKDLYFEQCFEVKSRLGAGSFGEVFKVKSKEDGQYYAIKKSQQRFRGESDRLRKLEEVAKQEKLPHHPNCVKFYRAWEERQHLYLQLELCKTSLTNLAETNHEIQEYMLWNYLVDLLMAVKHLHDNNLVHVDIKPDNIFISHDNVCKLGDFGLVIDLGKGKEFFEAEEGDPKYLAPELMDGKFGKPADIFSLGITILELASDLDPPRGGDGWHMLRRGQLPDEFLRDKSFDLKYVIQQMLDPDPRSRPTVDQVLAFPSVRKVWKRRRREYMIKNAVCTAKSSLFRLWEMILFLASMFILPFYKLLPNRRRSRCSSSNSSLSLEHSGLEHSLSDDDCFETDISINNNSIGAPLDSSSSGDSFLDEFQCKPPVRNAFTTPAVRHRNYNSISSPLSSSPVLPRSKGSTVSGLSPDPVCCLNSSWGEEERAITPTFNTNVNLDLDEDVTATKTNIEPKNLLGMFDAASDEEDSASDE